MTQKWGDAHNMQQVQGGVDRATALFGERVQNTMQNEEELKENQVNSNSEQKDIFSDSEQEDHFDEDDNESSVETVILGDNRNIERVVIDGDGLAWINIPIQVVHDLISNDETQIRW